MLGTVALAGFYHETNTFSARPTTFADFEDYQLAVGQEIIARYQGTSTELGGMIAAAAARGLALRPLLFAAAVPSGSIDRDCFDRIVAQILEALDEARPITGMLLVLHGAAVAGTLEDADGCLLAKIREAVGPDCPLVATTDYHANLSARMVDAADAIVGYYTYPHVDMAARGEEAVALLLDLHAGRRAAAAFRKLPLVTVPQRQASAEAPVAPVFARLHAIERQADIACATLAMGFPYADTGDLGAGVLVYGETAAAAAAAAAEIGDLLWSQRASFLPDLVSLAELPELLTRPFDPPLILVDPADNIGGGSAGDGTAVLQALLDARADGAVVVINDPEAVGLASVAGKDGRFAGPVGGRVDDQHGPPAWLEGTVRHIGEASFRHSGSYMTGFVTSMGLTAVVLCDGIQVVLTSLRTMPFDIEQLRCLGIEPAQQRIIVVKSAIAWRAAYGALAGSTVVLDTPGICPSNLARLCYRRRPKPLFPLETDDSSFDGWPVQ